MLVAATLAAVVLLQLLTNTATAFRLRKISRGRSVTRNSATEEELNAQLTRESNPRSGVYEYNQWKKAFQSQPAEFNYYISTNDIEGEIPKDLRGTLFRNRPSLFNRGEVKYGHYLDGDGCITRLTFANGKAHFRTAYVKTKEFTEEIEAQKVLYRGTFRTQREARIVGPVCLNNGFDLYLKNAANTNVVYWAGKLLALFEAGVPHRIDPITMETLGVDDMNIGAKSGLPIFLEKLYDAAPDLHNKLFGSFISAHPKKDFARDTMVSWQISSVPRPDSPLKTFPVLNIYEWDDKMKHAGPTRHFFEATSIAPHDFSLTDNYYVFVENRADTEVLPYILGTKLPAECINIEHTKPMKIHLVPRPSSDGRTNPAAKKLIADLVPGFTIHSVCAFEKSDRGRNVLELYSTSWLSETVASGKVSGGLLGSWEGVEDGVAPHFDQIPVTLLYHTVVDTSTGELVYHGPAKGMEQTIIEHPHANPLYEGKPCRYLYMSLGSCEGLSSPPMGYLRLDIETGERQEWFAPRHTFCEEVVVVPKNLDEINKKVSQGEPRVSAKIMKEDSVWVVTNMYDAVKDKTCFAIFDGERIDKGPVARIWTDRLPHSLHGSYTPDLFVDL